MRQGLRILVVLEMAGTVNALKRSLGILEADHGATLKFVASDVALSSLTAAGRECLTAEADPAGVIADFRPDVVLVGASAFERDNPKWTGLELRYGLAVMHAGIPVVLYRDYSGVARWTEELSAHPGSRELLTLLMFDRMTARVVEDRSTRRVQVVGSGFYDDLPNWDWEGVRVSSRAKLGIGRNEIAFLFNCGADRDRVLEALEPVVEGFLRSEARNLVFISTFHPKDPDAPYAPGPTKGTWVARPSAPYDPVLARLDGSLVRHIPEPVFRNAETDSQRRMAAADLIVMGPGSTETWTAVYGGIPQVIVATPLNLAKLAGSGIKVGEFDFVADGTADVCTSREQLWAYIAALPILRLAPIRELARRGKERYSAEPAAPRIAEAISEAASATRAA